MSFSHEIVLLLNLSGEKAEYLCLCRKKYWICGFYDFFFEKVKIAITFCLTMFASTVKGCHENELIIWVLRIKFNFIIKFYEKTFQIHMNFSITNHNWNKKPYVDILFRSLWMQISWNRKQYLIKFNQYETLKIFKSLRCSPIFISGFADIAYLICWSIFRKISTSRVVLTRVEENFQRIAKK